MKKKEYMYPTCPICKKEFPTKNKRQIYCSDKCRRKKANRSWKRYTKKGIIQDIQTEYQELKQRNPLIAQKIANEMDIMEGTEFRKQVLDGLAPYDNPSIYKKKGKEKE